MFIVPNTNFDSRTGSRRTGKVRKWPYDYQGESFTVRELSKVGQYDRNGTRISKGMAVNLELVPIN